MAKKISEQEEVGNKYGFLTVKSREGENDRGRSVFLCLCKCGTETIVDISHLRNGNTKSCGCLKHIRGFYGPSHILYPFWNRIKQRCYNPKDTRYSRYGGRGISVYKPWINKPELFIQWIEKNLGPRPEGKSLDRINNNGNYTPGNLRWASNQEQVRNSSKCLNRKLPIGVRKSGNRYEVTLHIGSFFTAKDAKEAYETAETAMRLLRDSF